MYSIISSRKPKRELLAITGAVDRQDLLREVDSALIPLARVAGAPVQVLGTIFVILGLGLGAIQTAYSLYELTCERLPRHEAPVIVLPRRRGRIVFEAGGRDPGLRLTLVYLGLDEAGPRLRLDVESNGRTQHHYITPGARWDAAQLAQVALGRHRLILEVTQAIAVHIVLRINSTMTLRYEGEWDTVGLGLVDMLELGEAEQRIMAWMMRSGGVSLAQVAAYLDQPETQAGEVLSLMIDEGLIAIAGNPGSQTYRVMLSPKRGRQGAAQIWAAIGQPQTNQRLPRSKPIQQRIRAGLLGEPGRAVLSMAPLGLSFILAEWGILSGSGSFSELIGLIGVAIIPLLTGLFPVLMLIASRRKGEYVPGVAYRLLGNPLVLGFIYVLSLTSLLLHGLVIWEEPVRRLVVLAVGGGVIVLTVLMIRRGAFTPRTVVRVCDDQRPDRKANYSLVSVGKLLAAPVLLTYAAREERADTQGGQLPDFQALRRVVVDLPARAVGELEIWVHRVTPESESEPLPARAEVRVGTNEARCFDLAAADGKVIVADSGEPCQVQIIMHDQS